MNNKSWFYGSFILLQALIYGFGNALTKIAYESISPFWCLSIRFGITSLIFIIFFGKHIITQLKDARTKDWLLPGLCMAVCYISCGLALDLTSATNVGFLMSLPIIFTPFIAVIVLKQPYRLIYLPVQIAILIGLYMLCSNDGAFAFGWGEAFAILTSISCAASFVFSEKSLKALDEITISATQIWLTFALSIPWAFLLEKDFSITNVSLSSWAVVLYLALFCTLIAFRLQNIALTKISSHTVSTLICSEPVFTAIVSRFILGEILNPIGLIGSIIIMVCIFGGNYLFNIQKDSVEISNITEYENPPV